eukprot:GHVU01214688.1.p1 GENE.GHVU01214688.1~~GHVU01214688.1.p1  ORF type:complete len:120 (+),score=3.04 GHVU01214688.1:372-731(+)
MMSLLSQISPTLDSTLPAGMICNIVTNFVTNLPTSLQIALGVVVRDKAVIEQLYDLGITCSYNEVLIFKASAAHAAAKSHEQMGLYSSGLGWYRLLLITLMPTFLHKMASSQLMLWLFF